MHVFGLNIAEKVLYAFDLLHVKMGHIFSVILILKIYPETLTDFQFLSLTAVRKGKFLFSAICQPKASITDEDIDART